MAFHESHERHCPHCGERMSATAPKCLNCGRYVDEEDENEAEARNWSEVIRAVAVSKVWFIVILSVVVGALVLLGIVLAAW